MQGVREGGYSSAGSSSSDSCRSEACWRRLASSPGAEKVVVRESLGGGGQAPLPYETCGLGTWKGHGVLEHGDLVAWKEHGALVTWMEHGDLGQAEASHPAGEG